MTAKNVAEGIKLALLVVGLFGAVSAWAIIPYRIALIEQQQARAAIDHDLLIEVKTQQAVMLADIKAVKRALKIPTEEAMASK